MRRFVVRVAIGAAVLVAGSLTGSRASAQFLGAGYCGSAGIPLGEPGGYVPLPRGNLFCGLLADPKEPHSFVSYQEGLGSDPLDTTIGAVGIGDSFGLVRISGRTPSNGVQLSLSGAVFAQFDLNTASYDLINADYIIALPLTFRYQGFSARARVYHQSSHLGDEFLLRAETERENLSFEAAGLILSQELGDWRVYGGGEYLFNREPEAIRPGIVQAGAELRPSAPLFRAGNLGSVRLVAGLDAKFSEEQDWTPGWSVRTGFEVGRGREGELPGRRWSLLLEGYDGPAPYGQFYRSDFSYFGIGMHFSL